MQRIFEVVLVLFIAVSAFAVCDEDPKLVKVKAEKSKPFLSKK